MAMWKKALVLVLASLVVALPVVSEVTMARPILLGVFPTRQAAQQALGASPAASQSSVVLPQGKELGDGELLQAEGRSLLVYMMAGGVVAVTSYLVTQISDHQPVHWYTAVALFFIGAFSGGALQYYGGGGW